MANDNYWLSVLRNYKSVRLMYADFRMQILDLKKIDLILISHLQIT
jgi:hypothetical protein